MNPSFSLSNKIPILVVEDEALIRAGLVLEFETAGYEVHEAASADEAMVLLQSNVAISAVVTDFRMPGRLDGLGLVSWLREHRPGLPVIVATGYPINLQREPYGAAVYAVVSKPYNASEIVSVLTQLQRSHRA
jgi:CheY-like chemotaxis protein